MKDEKQELVNICFQIGTTIHMYHDSFKDKSTEEVAEWVAKQLKECGFPTHPVGSLWGVLDKKKS